MVKKLAKEIEFIAKIRGGTTAASTGYKHSLEIFIPKVIVETYKLRRGTRVCVKLKTL